MLYRHRETERSKFILGRFAPSPHHDTEKKKKEERKERKKKYTKLNFRLNGPSRYTSQSNAVPVGAEANSILLRATLPQDAQ